VPNNPAPSYPNIPPAQPVVDASAVLLLAKLLAALIGGPMLANVLLLAILGWQIYRGIAKREGIPLLLDDDTAAQLTDLLRGRRPTSADTQEKASQKQ
jgi:hypothetical protein